AKWTACWADPHCRSTVVPGTESGNPAASAALRPMFMACSPTVMVQPITTSSTRAGSRSLRATSALSGSDARSTGCQSFSLPLRRPTAVRTASTMTAVGTAGVYGLPDAGSDDDLRLEHASFVLAPAGRGEAAAVDVQR